MSKIGPKSFTQLEFSIFNIGLFVTCKQMAHTLTKYELRNPSSIKFYEMNMATKHFAYVRGYYLYQLFIDGT